MSADNFAKLLRGDTSFMKCTVCKAQAGTCDCWTKCQQPGCTWSFRKGTACRSPAHPKPIDTQPGETT